MISSDRPTLGVTGARLRASCAPRCCVPGTARILKGALSLPFVLKLIKSQTQPDGGEGYSGMATGYPVTVLGEEAALPRQGAANARGDEQEPS